MKLLQPCKTLFINKPQIWKMYKGIRKKKRENLQDINVKKLSVSTTTISNRSAMVMGLCSKAVEVMNTITNHGFSIGLT
jgi:hypothetical protein